MCKLQSKLTSDKETVIVSLCSFGVACRYHGKTEVMGHSIYKEKKLAKMREQYNILPLCGEQLGGLPTPRPPCNVIEKNGELKVVGRYNDIDYTIPYNRGADEILRLARIYGVKRAFLLDKSPMCGKGYGILARKLEENGIRVEKI
jgi:uncharacterized protein YbbK (DUF523 family)